MRRSPIHHTRHGAGVVRGAVVVGLLVSLLPVGGPALAGPPSAGAVSAGAVSAGPPSAGAPVVRTESGLVRGFASGTHAQGFRGIPYARPPVGELRWRPPQPAREWHGVRDASRYGNRCPALASTNGPRAEAEDCLYLNVERPATARAGQRLPVYVWIHGGGLVNGSSNQHDGSFLASLTGVIVVTINYRLGVFGFLAHPALTAESAQPGLPGLPVGSVGSVGPGELGESGNYGLMDQQAALRWVRRNISAFGGDPRRVSIGGESAGGFSVCAHLSAPGSRGLFAQAMIQSGSCVSRTLEQAHAQGVSLATALGCVDAELAASCMRNVPAPTLLDAAPSGSFVFVRGRSVLPQDPDTAVRSGSFTRVPVLVGANRDEGRTFARGFIGSGQQQYESWVRGAYGTRADEILARYPWPAGAGPFTAAYLVGAIMTDSGLVAGLGGCTNLGLIRALARHTRTYAYEFDHRTGPGLTPEPPGYEWGAGHAAELAYLWPSFDNGTPIAPTFDAAERRLARDMARYWGSFVSAGRPAAAGSAGWPTFNRTQRVMALRAGGTSTTVPVEEVAGWHQCEFWDGDQAQP